MSPREPARHALYAQLEHVLGHEHADTLMTYLPQNPSDEVATKADIAVVRSDFERLETRFERLEDRFDRLEDKIDRMQRFYVGTVVGSMTALTAIFSLVVGILR